MPADTLPLPLLDYLAYRAGCIYLSDLKVLDGWQRARLARVLEQVSPQAANLSVWNDALAYLAQAPPERTAEDARIRLITALLQPIAKK